MSVNCINMPFKFTIMAAARTAYVRGECHHGLLRDAQMLTSLTTWAGARLMLA